MSERREFRDLVGPDTAMARIEALDIGGGTETVPLEEAHDRILATRVDAGIDVPGFDRASMDGYAVRARDTFGADETEPVVLPVVGAVHAGAKPDGPVDPGTAVEISTGAVMPDGADAVVMVERTDPVDDGDRVAIRSAVAPGDNVMTAGADIAIGERGLGPGTLLTAREIGLLAALGHETVTVRAAPSVGIISTGDELVRPGSAIDHEAGQIYDVNSHTIATAVSEAGANPVLYPHVGDDYEAMETMLQRAASECDLVVSSGSTSASAVDVIHRVIDERGEQILHGVAIKPGKPMLVGRIGGSAYVGLPGYPVSALMIFRRFVAPVLRRAAGQPRPTTATVPGRMATRERFGEGRTRLLPVGLLEDGAGDTIVYPVDKGSGATTSLVEADGIVEVEADTAFIAEGESVTVELFSSAVRPPTVLGVGEDDPALSQLLDRVERPRYLAVGSIEGHRRFERGIPDVAVLAGPVDTRPDGRELGGWWRRWGLVVPAGNPMDIEELGDLLDRDLRFVNAVADSGTRRSFEAALEEFLVNIGKDPTEIDPKTAIDGYERSRRGYRGPARLVETGAVDVALGIEAAAAASSDLAFVPIDEEPVRVWANPDRMEKPGVQSLLEVLDGGSDVIESLPGFHV